LRRDTGPAERCCATRLNSLPGALDAKAKAGRAACRLRQFAAVCVAKHHARTGAAAVDADQKEVCIHRE